MIEQNDDISSDGVVEPLCEIGALGANAYVYFCTPEEFRAVCAEEVDLCDDKLARGGVIDKAMAASSACIACSGLHVPMLDIIWVNSLDEGYAFTFVHELVHFWLHWLDVDHEAEITYDISEIAARGMEQSMFKINESLPPDKRPFRVFDEPAADEQKPAAVKHLEPEKILADEEQIKKVLEARDTLESFFGALEDQDFYEEC